MSTDPVQVLRDAVKQKQPIRDLDLSNAQLPGEKLSRLKGDFSKFDGADLSGADLSMAHLMDVDFVGAKLSGTVFRGATLWQCRFADADGTGGDFGYLKGDLGFFSSGTFDDAIFEHAKLSDAGFVGASLQRATFAKAYGVKANFRGCSARDANFIQAAFHGSDFAAADLRGADFSQGILKGCDFRGAQLEGAVFAGATVEDCHFDGAPPSTEDEEDAPPDRSSPAKVAIHYASRGKLDRALAGMATPEQRRGVYYYACTTPDLTVVPYLEWLATDITSDELQLKLNAIYLLGRMAAFGVDIGVCLPGLGTLLAHKNVRNENNYVVRIGVRAASLLARAALMPHTADAASQVLSGAQSAKGLTREHASSGAVWAALYRGDDAEASRLATAKPGAVRRGACHGAISLLEAAFYEKKHPPKAILGTDQLALPVTAVHVDRALLLLGGLQRDATKNVVAAAKRWRHLEFRFGERARELGVDTW